MFAIRHARPATLALLFACSGVPAEPGSPETDRTAGDPSMVSTSDTGSPDTGDLDTGVPEPWTCGDALAHHGFEYPSVQLGDGCWFAANLRSVAYANGDPIPSDLGSDELDTATVGAVSVYADGAGDVLGELTVDPATIEASFGRLYNWFAVVDDRGLCPDGWHVSTVEDWQAVIEAVGGPEVAGASLRSTGTLEDGDGLWKSPSAGTNASGFDGLPGGYRTSVLHGYTDLGISAGWWTDERVAEEGQPGSEFATTYALRFDHPPAMKSYGMLEWSHSVRCVLNP